MSDRKALVVGIDYYDRYPRLHGCVNDANRVAQMLRENGDGAANFRVECLSAGRPDDSVPRGTLRDKIRELFTIDHETALFYFAGHGYIEVTGGYIIPSDSLRGDEGIALSDIVTLANQSPARHRIIVLDSCFAGRAADNPNFPKIAELADGLTILAAATEDQYASEENNSGVFTNLFVDALAGSAANILGEVTPGSVYAHIDQSFGPWEQRPVFKTNVSSLATLRKARPQISLEELQLVAEFFPRAGYQFPLDPSFEPESENPDPANSAKFAILQKYNRINLVVPVDAPHMWHAAMWSKSCELTILGEHYRRLVAKNLI